MKKILIYKPVNGEILRQMSLPDGEVSEQLGVGEAYIEHEFVDDTAFRVDHATAQIVSGGFNALQLPAGPDPNAVDPANITGFAEAVQDIVAAMLMQGSNITVTYNDPAGQVTISASAGGGSDPWTYVKLAADFTTSSATAVDITGMAFTPAANTNYEFEACLYLRTATTTVGPRTGLAWATGLTDGVATIRVPSSATAELQVHGNIAAALLASVGGLPTTTSRYRSEVKGSAVAGTSPAGTIKLQMASETAGTNVTVKAGSWLKYRVI